MAKFRPAIFAVGLLVWGLLISQSQAQDPDAEQDAKRPMPSDGAPGRAISPTTITGFGIGIENPLLFLLAPTVKTELKLTADQEKKVDELAVDLIRKAVAMRQTLLIKGGDINAVMKAGERLRSESDRLVAKVLEKDQNARLREIVRQVEGLLAASRPEIASELKLDAKQSRAVRAIVQELALRQRQMTIQLRVAVANGMLPADRIDDEMQQSATQTRAEAAAMIGRVLNDQQKIAFQKLQGAPFAVDGIKPDVEKVFRTAMMPQNRPASRSRPSRKASSPVKTSVSAPKLEDASARPTGAGSKDARDR